MSVKCNECPLAGFCKAHEAQEELSYPCLPPKKPRRTEHRNVYLILCGDKCAVQKRPTKGLLAGLWELPNESDANILEGAEFCGEAVHVFSHVEWHMRGYILRTDSEIEPYTWVNREERLKKAIPSALRYYLEVLNQLGY